jgi:glucose dehydrogenase
VDSGELKWHFQCTPGDEWDFDAVQHLMLADIQINGSNRKVIMQVNKNGYFYVLDRKTGEFISGEAVAPVNWSTGLGSDDRASQRPSGCPLHVRTRCYCCALASPQYIADGVQSGYRIGLCPDLRR